MKQPTEEQLKALRELERYNPKVLEYIQVLIQECQERLVHEKSVDTFRQLQGSAGTLQELKQHITAKR